MTSNRVILNNIAFISHDAIDHICKPLSDNLGTISFNFVRIFSDGSRAMLMNNQYVPYNYQYYSTPELYRSESISRMESTLENSEYMWAEFNTHPNFIIGRNQFNLDNGVTIIEKFANYTDLYYIGGTRENAHILHLYMHQKDILYKFINYFQDKGHDLIKQACIEKFKLPQQKIISEPQLFDNTIDKINAAINPRKIFVAINHEEIYLTSREAQCLSLALHNLSAKEIAKQLDLSNRTVEFYLDKVKTKFNCRKISELIKLCHKNKIYNKLSRLFL